MITLGIIGVVAALTLPTVISHHNKKVTETKLAKFYSTMNEAIQRSIIDNGEPSGWWGETQTEINDDFINTYFMPYLNGAQYNSDTKTIMLADGTGMMFADKYGRDLYFCLSGDICARNDWDEINNLNGKKVFAFVFAPAYYARIQPGMCLGMGRPPRCMPDTISDYGSGAKTGIEPAEFEMSNEEIANTIDTNYNLGTVVIQRNGWKIPDNYPIRF